jgi:Baseplate J-like protein
MSRPPYPRTGTSRAGTPAGDLGTLDYLPLAYAELLAQEEELAVTRLGRPALNPDVAGEEPDAARTFMELSALVGHVLSVYQRYHAGEAFISTAQAGSSLVRHAHRLAYDPDPGLAATGYTVLVAKDGVAGAVEAGLPLASVPLGQIKAQDYETRDDVLVADVLNELLPTAARRAITIAPEATQLRLQGVGHRLAAGETVALVGAQWRGFVVEDATEEDDGTTTVALDVAVGNTDLTSTTDPPRLLAHPALTLRPFAADADAALFPPAAAKEATTTKPSTGDKYWYGVARADGTASGPNDVFLSEKARTTLVGRHVLRSTGAGLRVLRVTAEVVASVTLNREVQEAFTTQTVTLTPTTGGGFTSSLQNQTGTQTVKGHVSGTVTAITVETQESETLARSAQPFPADWLTDWRDEIALAVDEPNPSALSQPLELPGVHPSFTPGRPLVFSNLAETQAQVVTINRTDIDARAGVTSIHWDDVTPPPTGGWTLDDLKVFGNVARVSDGRTVHQTLGGSDGVTPFQRFALRESPVTVLPGVAGGEPALEVRVDGVRWDRVQDFAESGPDDRHYRSATDENGVTSVVFGDGRNGAVPPSGTSNVTASYRVGLGTAGNVEPRRLSRLKRAHPLLDHVFNVTPVAGGAEPADAAAIRSQSTRWIRTFDRAVSASDLADLALTMPGIARAASRWDSAGVVLVVATSEGEQPPSLDAVRAFLDARRDVSVRLDLRGPQPRNVQLAVNLDPDPAYLLEVAKNRIRAALFGDDPAAPGMFTFAARGLGQPAFLSEVYRLLEDLPGVIGVRITRFRAVGTHELAHVVTAGVDEWLRLRPDDLMLSASIAGTAA